MMVFGPTVNTTSWVSAEPAGRATFARTSLVRPSLRLTSDRPDAEIGGAGPSVNVQDWRAGGSRHRPMTCLVAMPHSADVRGHVVDPPHTAH